MENQLENALKVIDNLTESLQNSEKVIWTGFEFMDFLINTKKAHMDKMEIAFQLEVDLYHIPLTDTEIGVLLGNLLDNAIEAAEKCQHGHRKIFLKLCNRNEMFYLRIVNTSCQYPKRHAEGFRSAKKGEGHGFGIESIRQIVESHQGCIEFQYDDKYFEVTILI